MSQYPTDDRVACQPPPPVGTPPVAGGGLPAKRSVWPTVIGIITIIIGVLGTANNALCAPAVLLMSGVFKSMFQDMAQSAPGAGMEMSVAQMEAMSRYLPANLAVCFTSAVLSAVLLIGGIGLLRRRSWSGRTLNIWAILRILQAVPAMIVGYLANLAMLKAMEEAAAASGGSGQMPVGIFGIMQGAGLVGAALQLIIFWALPVFILIWFGRRVIRDEVAEWRR